MARSTSGRKSTAKPARRRRRGVAPGRGNDAALAAFAHDARTALTGILALGELLASSNLGERERRWAAGIKEGAEYLASLTTLVLDTARPNARGLKLRQEAFSPRQLLSVLGDGVAARAQAKDLQAEVEIADDLPEMLVGDPLRLRAALDNLVDNAVKFTSRGVVRLDARAARAARGRCRLVVTVTDSGIGLAPTEIRRLFRPFAQANEEIARRYGGSGLGLVIVKRVATLMGGDLTVTSARGHGSRFVFSAVLPIAHATSEQSTRAENKTPSASQLTVLCAEDNPYGRVILNTILTELGHRADFAASGEEAVAAVARGYDVLLMDVTFAGGVDGLEATRRIRALAGAAGRTPIIGISGHSAREDEERARAAGMDLYLSKPLSPAALRAALAAVLAGRGAAG